MKKIIFISIFVLALASFTSFFGVKVSADTTETINTCLDGLDNNDNTLVDAADPACDGSSTEEGASTKTLVVNPENTYALCTDGLDNNDNTLVDAADPACDGVQAPVVPPTVNDLKEGTLALCTDGLDNNDNTLVDAADPACSEILTAVNAAQNNENSGSNSPSNNPENTYALCTDGLDNNDNTLVDAADPACDGVQAPATTTPTVPTTPTVTPTTIGPTGGSGGGSGFSSGGSITSGTPISSTATSTNVDGINMSCGDLFKTYMKKGNVNNKAEVLRLQAFLNKNLNLKLKVDGVFGSQTEAAVKKFQLKYKDSTLTPWGLKLPTGYVFKTTQRQLNLLVCPANDIPMPILK